MTTKHTPPWPVPLLIILDLSPPLAAYRAHERTGMLFSFFSLQRHAGLCGGQPFERDCCSIKGGW